ncbi:MAG: creatininase family protein [Planctomycetota bacterium]
MIIRDLHWSAVEAYVRSATAPTAVIPLGCTEQHAFLSLSTDSILAARVAEEAAEPTGVPVFPVLHYGITPGFLAYPGTVSLRVETYLRVVRDVLDSLAITGFRRVLLVNGHGGNVPVAGLLREWMADRPDCRARLHNWWNAPRTIAHVQRVDPVASHASWMENFPWTRLAGVTQPQEARPMADLGLLAALDPAAMRRELGDGNFGGAYEKPDEVMLAIWATAVEETRDAIRGPWGDEDARQAVPAAM